MLRTIILRNQIGKNLLRKAVRAKTIKAITVECVRKRHYYRMVGADNTQLLSRFKVAETTQIRRYADFPKHTRVTLPALSPTMESGSIITWEKKEGDKLNEGDLLAEIETDKATMGFETPEEGYLAKILIPAGTKDVPVGKLVCVIVENQADVAAFGSFVDDSPAVAAKPKPASDAPTPPAPAPPAPAPAAPAPAAQEPVAAEAAPGGQSWSDTLEQVEQGRVYASPMAKRLAEQRQVRLQGKGTGLFGSITSADVPAAGAGPAAAPAGKPAAAAKAPLFAPGSTYVDIPVSGMRATIAKRLLQSKQNVPHYYLSVEANVDKLLAIRNEYNKKLEKTKLKLSVNDFIIKAVAMACVKVPEANSAWMDKHIRQYKNVDVSVAVSTDKGLITPIVFEAERKGIIEISKDVKMLAGKAREGKLQSHEFQGGTVTVSNLGMFGVHNFCAIINPPQSCILAIGNTTKRLVLDPKSEKGFKESDFLNVTLSCDHRTVDGAVGAEWLKHVKNHLEDPVSMVI